MLGKREKLTEASTLEELRKVAIEKDEPIVDLIVKFDNIFEILNFTQATNA